MKGVRKRQVSSDSDYEGSSSSSEDTSPSAHAVAPPHDSSKPEAENTNTRGGSSNDDTALDQTKLDKLASRRQRNKVSAAASRQRAKMYTRNLEVHVNFLTQKVHTLEAALAHARAGLKTSQAARAMYVGPRAEMNTTPSTAVPATSFPVIPAPAVASTHSPVGSGALAKTSPNAPASMPPATTAPSSLKTTATSGSTEARSRTTSVASAASATSIGSPLVTSIGPAVGSPQLPSATSALPPTRLVPLSPAVHSQGHSHSHANTHPGSHPGSHPFPTHPAHALTYPQFYPTMFSGPNGTVPHIVAISPYALASPPSSAQTIRAPYSAGVEWRHDTPSGVSVYSPSPNAPILTAVPSAMAQFLPSAASSASLAHSSGNAGSAGNLAMRQLAVPTEGLLTAIPGASPTLIIASPSMPQAPGAPVSLPHATSSGNTGTATVSSVTPTTGTTTTPTSSQLIPHTSSLDASILRPITTTTIEKQMVNSASRHPPAPTHESHVFLPFHAFRTMGALPPMTALHPMGAMPPMQSFQSMQSLQPALLRNDGKPIPFPMTNATAPSNTDTTTSASNGTNATVGAPGAAGTATWMAYPHPPPFFPTPGSPPHPVSLLTPTHSLTIPIHAPQPLVETARQDIPPTVASLGSYYTEASPTGGSSGNFGNGEFEPPIKRRKASIGEMEPTVASIQVNYSAELDSGSSVV